MSEVQQPQKVFIETQGNRFRNTVKHVHRDIRGGENAKPVRFVSYAMSQILFMGDNEFIQFSGREYITDQKNQIEFIRKHPIFNNGVWEKEFPEAVRRKFKKDREYITSDELSFVQPDRDAID